MLPLPNSKRPRIEELQARTEQQDVARKEPMQSYLWGLVSSVARAIVLPVVGNSPVLNRAINCDIDFDLSKSEDNLEVDILLIDLINTQQQSSCNRFKISYANSGFGREKLFV